VKEMTRKSGILART